MAKDKTGGKVKKSQAPGGAGKHLMLYKRVTDLELVTLPALEKRIIELEKHVVKPMVETSDNAPGGGVIKRENPDTP